MEGFTAVPSDGNTTSICVLLNFDAPENLCMLYGGMVAFVYLCIGVHNRCFKEDWLFYSETDDTANQNNAP